ncbi:tRNA nucleotidyltransferase (CCA-adding enzyme) [Pancytospora philotis]|nr:tRNA nucleotidyltransferase (CCA-adding enzyme) [Pancytospora philotis]
MPELQLNKCEQKIADIIRAHAESLNPPCVARFAGGWVRDKIMGTPSSDIDVTLDNVSGYQFAVGLAEKYAALADSGADADRQPSVHKISANPDKSKHLETAVVHLYGVSVDFAQLRSETYAETRIPTTRQGTPEDDAKRRDLTINALFYNVHTHQVEDFTDKGRKDIRDRIIRTPMDASTTLREDPLRILRIFRFNAKLNFAIDDSIYEALRDPSISEALKSKVSSERIETELFKMLDYTHGYLGLLNILRTGYVAPVFSPPVQAGVDVDGSIKFHTRCAALLGLEICDSGYSAGPAYSLEDATAELVRKRVDAPTIRLYIVLNNFIGLKAESKKREEFVNALIMQDGLKSSKSRVSSIRCIEDSIAYIRDATNRDPVEMGLFCGEHLFEALVICAAKYGEERYIDLIKFFASSKRYDWYKTRPRVNGNDLVAMGVQPRDIKQGLHKCLVYQIKYPKAKKKRILGVLRSADGQPESA